MHSPESPNSLDPGGPAAQDIAALWWFLLVLGTVVFLLVLALLLIPLLRRPRQGAPAGDDRAEVPAALTHRWIVGLGIVLTGVLLIVVLVFSVATMRNVSRAAPADSVEIDVVGHQFWWAASYPAADVTVANEIHIPVGEPVELRLTSADVIHSFWAPELHGKLDLLPDGTNVLVLEADRAGEYGGECAEFCGLQHTNMGFLVIAQPRAEFDAWLEAQRAPAAAPTDGPAAEGARIFASKGCGQCHVVRGGPTAATPPEIPGPDLTHVSSRRTIASDTVANTPGDMTAWLRDPQSIKPGTSMPSPELTDEQVTALVAYLEGLE